MIQLTPEQERTLTLLRRSERWSQEGDNGEWVTLKGLRRNKPTEEIFLRRILVDLLTLGAVECDDSQRIVDTPFRDKQTVSVRYWQAKKE